MSGPKFLQPEPILDRAWTFQERAMSKWLIIVQSQLFWMCAQAWGNDGGLVTYESYLIISSLTNPALLERDIGLPRLHFSTSFRPSERPVKDWMQIVELYSTMQLSKEADKLPALSCIAQVFAHPIHDDYVAGIWRSFVLQGLCWSLETATALRTITSVGRPLEWRCPSWSPFYVTGPISYTALQRNLNPPPEVLECAAVPASDDAPFGQIVSTRLRIRGNGVQLQSRPNGLEWMLRAAF